MAERESSATIADKLKDSSRLTSAVLRAENLPELTWRHCRGHPDSPRVEAKNDPILFLGHPTNVAE